MNKKVLIVLVAVVLIAAVAVILFVFVLGDSEPKIVRTEYAPGEYFVVNVKDTNPQRYLKTTLVLVLNTDKLEDFLEENTSLIRDTINKVLRNMDESVFYETDMLQIKTEICAALNEILEIDNITDILVRDIVVQ